MHIVTLVMRPCGCREPAPEINSQVDMCEPLQTCHASVGLQRRLVELGAWRTLRNARGERAVDVAGRLGHNHLLGVLKPAFRHQVPGSVSLNCYRPP